MIVGDVVFMQTSAEKLWCVRIELDSKYLRTCVTLNVSSMLTAAGR